MSILFLHSNICVKIQLRFMSVPTFHSLLSFSAAHLSCMLSALCTVTRDYELLSNIETKETKTMMPMCILLVMVFLIHLLQRALHAQRERSRQGEKATSTSPSSPSAATARSQRRPRKGRSRRRRWGPPANRGWSSLRVRVSANDPCGRVSTLCPRGVFKRQLHSTALLRTHLL